VGIVYLVLAAVMIVQQRRYVRPLARDGLIVPVRDLFHESDDWATATEPARRGASS
jgi:hypothetical protein